MRHKDSLVLSIENLAPVAEMMRDAGLEPKKQFGQNFLFDLNLTGRIARSVPGIENTIVFEIGPGPGGLTRAILTAGSPRVIAIEKDTTTKPILDKIVAASDGRLSVVYADALKFTDFGGFNVNPLLGEPQNDMAICANLPYNVGTQLLINWLHLMAESLIASGQSIFSSMTLMFQKEVAQRIVARPGDEHYGRLSVLTSLITDARILFDVPNTAFVPRPKVTSSVVQILPKKETGGLEFNLATLSQVEQLTAKLFGQRRKMIRAIIKNVDWSEFGLTGTERAEELSPEKFVEIAKELAGR